MAKYLGAIRTNIIRPIGTDFKLANSAETSYILASDAGNIDVVTANTYVNLLNQSSLKLQDAVGVDYVGFKAPTTVTTSYTVSLPTNNGISETTLSTNGAGTLSWHTPVTNGVIVDGGNAEGANISIGTNDNFDVSFITNGVSRMTLASGGLTVAGDLIINGATTTVSSASLRILDAQIEFAASNSADIKTIGLYGQYNDGSDKYTGLLRKIGTDQWYLINDSTEPVDATDPSTLSKSNIKVANIVSSAGFIYNFNTTAITSTPYTVLATDYALEFNNGADQINLPAVSAANAGQEYILVNISSGSITINRNGSDVIDVSDTSIVLSTQYSKIKLISNGTDRWYSI